MPAPGFLLGEAFLPSDVKGLVVEIPVKSLSPGLTHSAFCMFPRVTVTGSLGFPPWSLAGEWR